MKAVMKVNIGLVLQIFGITIAKKAVTVGGVHADDLILTRGISFGLMGLGMALYLKLKI